jgi:alkyl sulfatase BDS1-like metallo-beta-lactamase superfamily hydrolase
MLRNGVPPHAGTSVSVDMVRAMSPQMFFDFLAVRLDSEKAVGHDLTLNWTFEDLNKDFNLTLRNGVLTHRAGLNAQADAGVTMSKATLGTDQPQATGHPHGDPERPDQVARQWQEAWGVDDQPRYVCAAV